MAVDSPIRRARPATGPDRKLELHIVLNFLEMLLAKTIGRVLPIRFVMFCLVGGLGGCVHMAVLSVAHVWLGMSFQFGQVTAIFIAMTFNFLLNNATTFRDRAVAGWRGYVIGAATFYAVCTIGAVLNYLSADFIFGRGVEWWLAAMAGMVVGAGWNFVLSNAITWRRGRPED